MRIGMILIAGVTLTGVVVASGGLLYLLHHGAANVHYRVFRGEPTDLRTIQGVVRDALRQSGRGVIQLGLVILVAVQLIRVALTAWLFAVMRDRVYVSISLFILIVLSYSLFGQG